MNFEPHKYYIGLIDFFSILLPGALITYLFKDNISPALLFGKHYSELGDAEMWMVFFFSSYLIGHFIFLVGSYLLDDYLYDPIQNATYVKQIERLANGKKLSTRITRLLANWFFKNNADKALNQAIRIKEHYLDPLKASSVINTFQWSKARLTCEQPAALATVQRFEADSKFFRSLIIVFFLLFLFKLVSNLWIALGSFLLLPLAFLRYMDQRMKATRQAYWFIITMECQREGGYRHQLINQTLGPSHAGGVVFKLVGNEVKYLLVRAKSAPQEWVLPKGHIECGEHMQETAVREVREETGVWARIQCELDMVSFQFNDTSILVQFYVMEALAEEKLYEQREHRWFPLPEALRQMSHMESKEMLKLAEQKRTAL